MIQRHHQAFQNVAARFRLVEIIFRSAANHVLLMFDVMVNHLLQRQNLRFSIHQRQHDRAERVLHLRVLVKRIQNDARIRIAL